MLTGVAIVGAAVAVFTVVDTNRKTPVREPAVPVERSPFTSYVVGTGITEIGRGNVSVGTSVTGLVREIDVQVNDRVEANDALFKIDDRDLQAQLVVAQANVGLARAALAKPQHQLDFLTKLQALNREAISVASVSNARDDTEAAASAVVAAQALVAQIQSSIERSVVRAPTAGRILQINIRVGEFATNGVSARPLMLTGDDVRQYLRVNIDENDAWRVQPEAEARAFVRGNPELTIPLRFEYIEPYVSPKTTLTGQGTERSDLRVLQVIYSFEQGVIPVRLGQQMDAFIQTRADSHVPSR